MRVATREGSARGRLGGRGCSGAAEADCPNQGRVRGGWVSRSSKSANHSFSGQRGATRVIATRDDSQTRAITRPTRGKGGNVYRSGSSQGCRNTSSKTAWGSGTSEQYRGSFALRVERPLCPYYLPATAEDICQDIGLSWKIPRIEMDVETLRPSQKAAG